MVTQNEATPQTEDATPEVTEATPDLAPNEVSLASDEPIEEQGRQPEAEGAATDATDGAAQTEETSAETPAETIAREEHEAELAKVRQGLDKRISDIEKQRQEDIAARQAAEERFQQAQAVLEAQQLDISVAQKQRERSQHWQTQGLAEDEAQRIAAVELNLIKAAWDDKQRADRAEAELQKLRGENNELGNRQAAVALAQEHGVPEEDIRFLRTAQTPEAMTEMAKRLGELSKQSQELNSVKQAEVPSGGEANQLDSGGGSDGAMTDQQKIAAFADGDPSVSMEEYQAIRKRMGFS